MKIPFFRSPWQTDAVAPVLMADVLGRGCYVLGEEVQAFERELAQWLGCREVVAVNSGTDALVLALHCLGIGPGDEVLVPAYTFIACMEAVRRVGATPVLVDSAETGFLPDVTQFEARRRPACKAVLAVPLFGETRGLAVMRQWCDDLGLMMVEDVAQALGGSGGDVRTGIRRAGTFGDASTFSFYPTKNLGAAGDGGALAFRDPSLSARCRRLRNHGAFQGMHREIGFNSRLDELQACLLRRGLQRLEWAVERRRILAERYVDGMVGAAGLLLPVLTPGHAWNYFVVCHPERDALRIRLEQAGVESRVYYSRPIHREEAWGVVDQAIPFPHAERLAKMALALPMYPDLGDAEAAHVIQAVVAACSKENR